MITRQVVVTKIKDYLNHQLSLEELVDWAEEAMRKGEFEAEHFEALREIISRLGLADVSAFGLTWGEWEGFLERLGYRVKIEISETP